MKRDCKVDIKCSECGSRFHCSALHTLKIFVKSTQQHGGEDDNKRTVNIVNKCTDVCGSHIEGKSCAKILPINVTHIDYPLTSLKAYMILDGQSNRTLVRSEPLDYFDIHSTPKEYTLSSCSGKSLMSGRRANGFVIISLDRKSEICLPEVIECQGIPNSRNEIPTPDIIRHHPHLRRIMTELNPLDCEAEILMHIMSWIKFLDLQTLLLPKD